MEITRIETIVKDAIRESSNIPLKVENNSSLESLNLDSIDAISILCIIDSKLETELPAEIFDKSNTVQDIIENISKHISQ